MNKLLPVALCAFFSCAASAQSLYQYQPQTPGWLSPETRAGTGKLENHGAKGHPYDTIKAHHSLDMGTIDGAGVVRRIWLTLSDRSPRMLRSLHLQIFWDGAKTPAVSVPLGDFFGFGLDGAKPYENALFASPQGRSFISMVPMPFRQNARFVLTNDSDRDLTQIFYDIDYTHQKVDEDALYFHANWHRQNPTTLGEDFQILPPVPGRGRYVGASLAVITNPAYKDTWWGEGEVKVYFGGSKQPTLVGTGTEDYIGDGYGQQTFVQRYSGSLVASPKTRHWLFYRLHLPDPIYFDHGAEVTIQKMGGGSRAEVVALKKAGAPMKFVSLDPGGRAHFIQLLAPGKHINVESPTAPDGWLNFYRQDDVAATVYYYLDQPGSPYTQPLAAEAQRVAGTPPDPAPSK
jgi:hypothetical protein